MNVLKKFLIIVSFLISAFTTCFPVSPPQPFNFTQNNNWCWMTAALQCFYRVEEFRNTLKKIVAQNISPTNSAYEPWIFFKKLDALFSRMETERSDLSSLYDFVFTRKRPEHEIIMQKKFMQDYFDKVQNKFKDTLNDNYITYLSLKRMIIDSSLKDLTKKYGEQNEPFKFIIFVYAALKSFAHLQPSEQLIQWASSDFIGCGVDNSENIHELIQRKKSCALLIIHGDDEGKILNESINLNGISFELIGICMHLPGHYIALVKYGNQWVKLDSCGNRAGEKKGENYSEILSELAKVSTHPTQYFYQKKQKPTNTNKPLKLKLTDLKKKLTMLSTKLKDLAEALTNLRKKLKPKSL